LFVDEFVSHQQLSRGIGRMIGSSSAAWLVCDIY